MLMLMYTDTVQTKKKNRNLASYMFDLDECEKLCREVDICMLKLDKAQNEDQPSQKEKKKSPRRKPSYFENSFG